MSSIHWVGAGRTYVVCVTANYRRMVTCNCRCPRRTWYVRTRTVVALELRHSHEWAASLDAHQVHRRRTTGARRKVNPISTTGLTSGMRFSPETRGHDALGSAGHHAPGGPSRSGFSTRGARYAVEDSARAASRNGEPGTGGSFWGGPYGVPPYASRGAPFRRSVTTFAISRTYRTSASRTAPSTSAATRNTAPPANSAAISEYGRTAAVAT
jgi:hypothetical protein